MKPFKIKDGFGSEIVLFGGRYPPGYGITSVYLVNQEVYTEKEPKVLSSDAKFALHIAASSAIHTLHYKTYESAQKALDDLTKAANKDDG